MSVAELIERLKSCDQTKHVVIEDDDTNEWLPIEKVDEFQFDYIVLRGYYSRRLAIR